jgi:YVTN family beta-propeller protein
MIVRVVRGPEGFDLSPDGTRAYVALSGDNSVAVIDLKTLTESARLKTGSSPDGLARLEAK